MKAEGRGLLGLCNDGKANAPLPSLWKGGLDLTTMAGFFLIVGEGLDEFYAVSNSRSTSCRAAVLRLSHHALCGRRSP